MLQDHAGFSEVQPILFAQQREEIPCSKKFLAALPLPKISMAILIQKCALRVLERNLRDLLSLGDVVWSEI